MQRSDVSAGRRVEYIDRSVAKIADQQIVSEIAESGRRDGESPWRIEMSRRDQPLHQRAGCIEDIHVSIAGAGRCEALAGILQRIGHVEFAAEILNIEGSIPGGQHGVFESPGHGSCERAVKDVDRPGVKIGGVQEGVGIIRADRQTGIRSPRARVVHFDDGIPSIHLGIPGGYGAVQGIEDERCGFSRGNLKACRRIKHCAGRYALTSALGRRYGHHERDHATTRIVKRGNALAGVGDPEGTGGRFGDAPRSDQIGVGVVRELGDVRNQVTY